jgi:hypothetical protein
LAISNLISKVCEQTKPTAICLFDVYRKGDQKIGKKIRPIFQKVAKTVSKPKKAKISTTKLKLKAQNIYIKPLLKPQNTFNKPCFETAYLCENVINLLKQKVAQNVAISLGYFIFSKIHNEPPNVTQFMKKCPIWSLSIYWSPVYTIEL